MRIACLLALAITLASAPAHAQEPAPAAAGHGPFGLGLVVGQPTGLTMELELSEHTAIDAAVGLDLIEGALINGQRVYFHLEFLYFLATLADTESLSLAVYIGAGGFIVDHPNRLGLGVRAPLGLSLEFTAIPIEIFLEAALHLRLVPDGPVARPAGALGFRYYF